MLIYTMKRHKIQKSQLTTKMNNNRNNHLKTITLNVNNFKANSMYINQIASSNHMATSIRTKANKRRCRRQANSLQSDRKRELCKIQRTPIRRIVCWIVSKRIYIKNKKFIDEIISELIIQLNNRPLCLIGVYLPHFTGDPARSAIFSSCVNIL